MFSRDEEFQQYRERNADAKVAPSLRIKKAGPAGVNRKNAAQPIAVCRAGNESSQAIQDERSAGKAQRFTSRVPWNCSEKQQQFRHGLSVLEHPASVAKREIVLRTRKKLTLHPFQGGVEADLNK